MKKNLEIDDLCVDVQTRCTAKNKKKKYETEKQTSLTALI